MTKEIQNQENGVDYARTYNPHIDIIESAENISIVADIPGVDENSINITLEKNILSIAGPIGVTQPDKYSLAYAEYEPGSYKRSFTLSDIIDQENIAATVKDGVLNLTLPKTAPAQAKKIAVQAA